MTRISSDVRAQLDDQPVFDVHTHLGMHGLWQARNLADIVSYHWFHLELVRAGADLTRERAVEDPQGYMAEALPFFPAVCNTSNHYILVSMLRDLYGLEGRTLTAENWRGVDAVVRERAEDDTWFECVLAKAGIEKLMVRSDCVRERPSSRFVPYAHGESMFAPCTRELLAETAGSAGGLPTTATALTEAIGAQVDRLARDHAIRALHVWIRDTWSPTDCSQAEANGLLARVVSGENLSLADQDRLISFSAGALADAAGRHRLVIQLFHGMNRYTQKGVQGIASFWNPDVLRALPRLAVAHPATHFDVFLATRIPSHEMASLARAARNLSPSGAWWHGFTPGTLVQFFGDRLELLPNTTWNAFYSDGYIVEWVYAKLLLTKLCLAKAMAAAVTDGFLTAVDVPEIARNLLFDNALRIYGE